MSSRLSPRLSPRLSAALLLLGLAAACDKDNPKLLVTGIEPDKGDVGGGTYVRIHGNRFIAEGPRSVKVYFGGHEAQVDRFVSDTELIVVAPGGKLNDVVDVLVVFDPGGKAKLSNAYRFVEKGKGATVDDLNTSGGKK